VIYVFANDDHGLTAYASQEEAISACEAVDVEADNYRFFSATGRALRPRVTRPSSKGIFAVVSGEYLLEPDDRPATLGLAAILAEVSYVEGCGLTTVSEVKVELGRMADVTAHVPSNTSLERTRDR
jgi:hypothetical protein